MGDLGMGDRMLARIAAALVTDGRRPALYVMDEPTAALSAAEAERLFGVIARLTAEGAAVLYVSHRLPEVLRICHDVTVLRDGRVALTGAVADTDAPALIAAMTGRAAPVRAARVGTPGAVVAVAQGLRSAAVAGIDLALRAGEVVGIAAPDDGSASALLGLFCGRGRATAGRLDVLGRPAPRSPRAAWARGVAVIPRDRRAEGLALPMPVMANMLMAHLSQPFPRRRAEAARAVALGSAVSLRARGVGQAVRELSGGNQQKVLFARAIAGDPQLLLLDDPTRGVDIGARAEIHALIGQATARGCAVLVASTDLPELLDLSDRILVLGGGRQVALLPAEGLTAAGLLTRMQEAA
jgi:ABC-type sugar transport system ATPase subunit